MTNPWNGLKQLHLYREYTVCYDNYCSVWPHFIACILKYLTQITKSSFVRVNL